MTEEWRLRTTAVELSRRYRGWGLWDDQTLGALIESGLRRGASSAFRVRSREHPWSGTLGDVHRLARRVAGGLRARGIGPGDVVAFQLPNWVEAAATFYGCSLLGAVVVPVVHFYGAHEVAHILRQSRARVFVCAAHFRHLDGLAILEQVAARLPDLELSVVVGEAGGRRLSFDVLADAPPVDAACVADPDGPALIAYTSGTTAEPRGAVHTHRSIGAEVRQLAAAAPSGPPALVGAPISHAIGLLGGLLVPVHRGQPVHMIDLWEPDVVLDAMLEDGLSAGSGATYFLTSLLDHSKLHARHLALMRQLGLGGAPVPAAVADRATAMGISLVRFYGCTEHPSITGGAAGDPPDRRRYSDGRPLAGVEVRVVDDGGVDLAAGEAGEILSRGPDLFAGYLDPSLTDACIDRDGWFATGDVGVLDGGYLTITDRKKDIIIRGGENISAAEVEQQLLLLPGVAEVAVVAAPDARLGEHACAFVRCSAGAAAPTLHQFRAHLEQVGLARQKWPEELRVVDDLPRTASGKVQKFVLRQSLRDGAAQT